MNEKKENTVHDYIESRLKTLRQKYRDTGEIEFLHRYNELKRAKEHFDVQTTSTQTPRPEQGQGRKFDPFAPYQ